MNSFKLIRVNEEYSMCNDVIRKLFFHERLHICDMRHVGSIPRELTERIKMIPLGSNVIILNHHSRYSSPKDMTGIQIHAPFRNMYRNCAGSSVLDRYEALRTGNYFLCIEPQLNTVDDGVEEQSYYVSPSNNDSPYRCHVDIEELGRWVNEPPYVNLDRSSDQIGGSSWDGNLVSWFRSQFRTRLLYGVQTGLYPEE